MREAIGAWLGQSPSKILNDQNFAITIGKPSTGWKVKGLHRHSVKCVRGTSLLHRSSGGHTARGLRHDRDGRIVIERAAGGNASSQCGISTWAEDSRRRITATPTRLKAMDSSRTRRNEPVA